MTLREPDALPKDMELFLSNLVHDLRNLLDGVAMMLPRDAGPSPEALLQEATFRNVYDVLRKAEDYRARVGPQARTEGATEVSPVLERVIKALRPFLRERNLSVSSSDEAWVEMDARPLRAMLENILHVIAKRTGKGDAIRLVLDAHEDVHVACEAPALAVPTRPEELFSTDFKDGLDLWASREIARAHDGDLVCEPLESGLRVVLRLPRRESAGTETQPWTRQRILIVDDNSDSAKSLAMILSSAGFETEVCIDGTSVRDVSRSFHPEALVLDLGLPDIDGYEVCRRLRAEPGGDQLLILAVSGRGDDATLAEVETAGFDEHFLKPVDAKQLIRRLCE